MPKLTTDYVDLNWKLLGLKMLNKVLPMNCYFFEHLQLYLIRGAEISSEFS